VVYKSKVLNYGYVAADLKWLSRRKGKLVPMSSLQDGDLFRFDGEYDLLLFRLYERSYGIYSAWSVLGGYLAVGTGGELKDLKGRTVRFIAHRDAYARPKIEPATKTFIYRNSDGTICCQNIIYFHAGQHFKITLEQLAQLKAKTPADERSWIEETEPCDCDLPLGMVKEYDGSIHSKHRNPRRRRNPGEAELYNYMRGLPELTMIFTQIQAPGGPQPAFLVRESSQWLKLYPLNIRTELTAAVMHHGHAYVVVVILKVIDPVKIGMIGMYETYFNYYSTDPEPREVMQLLATQPSFNLIYHGDNGRPERRFIVNTASSLRSFFALAPEGLRGKPPWTMAEFDQAKKYIQNKYSLEELWQELKRS
jgi:hypothetical protein